MSQLRPNSGHFSWTSVEHLGGRANPRRVCKSLLLVHLAIFGVVVSLPVSIYGENVCQKTIQAGSEGHIPFWGVIYLP